MYKWTNTFSKVKKQLLRARRSKSEGSGDSPVAVSTPILTVQAPLESSRRDLQDYPQIFLSLKISSRCAGNLDGNARWARRLKADHPPSRVVHLEIDGTGTCRDEALRWLGRRTERWRVPLFDFLNNYRAAADHRLH